MTSAPIVPEDHASESRLVLGGDMIARDLASQLRSAFPELQFSTAVVEERGGDHRVLLLDATYAFRFPRETMHDLELEIAVLAALRGRCEIAVPDYRFIDPAGHFAGYPFIAGEELTPQRFAALTPTIRHRVLDQAGRFLAALHRLVPDDVLGGQSWPVFPTGAHQAAEARAHRLPQIARAFPTLAPLIDDFYDACSGDGATRQVILHGDLVEDHILLAANHKGLSGIIDFADVALGDPAQDLIGLWAYGAHAVTRALAAYGSDGDDDLHARSRRAFVRYRIDRFAELLTSEGKAVVEQSLPALFELLSTPGSVAPLHTFQSTDAIQRR